MCLSSLFSLSGTEQAWNKDLFNKLSTFQSSVLIPQIHLICLEDSVNNSMGITLHLYATYILQIT